MPCMHANTNAMSAPITDVTAAVTCGFAVHTAPWSSDVYNCLETGKYATIRDYRDNAVVHEVI